MPFLNCVKINFEQKKFCKIEKMFESLVTLHLLIKLRLVYNFIKVNDNKITTFRLI